MAFNNAVNANQQGTQYLSTGGAWSGVDGSTAGFVLTSNGTGVVPSFQTTASVASLSPYIVGTTGTNDFATITAAIAQAVIDGATNANQINIYVKQGVYVENITIPAGVNIIGMTPNPEPFSVFTPSFPNLSARLQGTITVSAASVETRIINLGIVPIGAVTIVTVSGLSAAPSFENCVIQGAAGSTCFSLGNSSQTSIHGCYVDATLGTFFTLTSGGVVLTIVSSSVIAEAAASTVGVFDITFRFDSCYLQFPISDVAPGSAVIVGFNSFWGTTAASITASGVGFNIVLNNCRLFSTSLTTFAGTGTLKLTNCNFFGGGFVTSAAGFSLIKLNVANLIGGISNITNNFVGFAGSDFSINQGSAQTIGAVTSPLGSFAVPANSALTCFAEVSGTDTGFTGAVGGTISGVIRRAGGAPVIVGAPISTVYTDIVGATFTIALAGNNIILNVTGAAGNTINWMGTMQIQQVQTNIA